MAGGNVGVRSSHNHVAKPGMAPRQRRQPRRPHARKARVAALAATIVAMGSLSVEPGPSHHHVIPHAAADGASHAGAGDAALDAATADVGAWTRHPLEDVTLGTRPPHVLRLFQALHTLQFGHDDADVTTAAVDERDAHASTAASAAPRRPPWCDDPEHRLLVVSYRAAEEDMHGFAAQFQHLAAALAIGLMTNRTVVEHSPEAVLATRVHRGTGDDDVDGDGGDVPVVGYDGWRRAPTDDCHGRLMGCYFRPLSACAYTPPSMRSPRDGDANGDGSDDDGAVSTYQYTDGPGPGVLLHSDEGVLADTLEGARAQTTRVVHVPGMMRPRRAFKQATSGDYAPAWFRQAAAQPPGTALARVDAAGKVTTEQDLNGPRAVPLTLPSGPEFFAAVEDYLFRPRPHVMDGTAGVFAALGASRPVLGMHVRLGDAAELQYRIAPGFTEYLAHAVTLRWVQPAFHALFVATDEAGTVEAATAQANDEQFTMLSARRRLVQHPHARVHTETFLADAPSEALALTTDVVRDVAFLASCDAFVGTCMSQVGRLATELALSRGSYQQAPVAVDYALCRGFSMHFYSVRVDWRAMFDAWRD